MPMTPVALGPFSGGLNNAAGSGEGIDDKELFLLENLEVERDGGSVVNRPAIKDFAITGVAAGTPKLLGTFLPADGRKYLVVVESTGGIVHLINSVTGASVSATTGGRLTNCCIQYQERLYVITKTGSTAVGGYFDNAATPVWHDVAALPKGEAAVLYKERIWIACGASEVTNPSRFYFSAIGDATTWGGTDYVDVAKGNGQKLIYMTTTNNDIILFKEHSTYRFGYATDPAKADISIIDERVGVPAPNCAVTYNNNTIYSLHDNSVYELYNNVYTRISNKINMVQAIDATIYSDDVYGLTLYRDRLFVRYYSNIYVYSLDVERWSTWKSTKKFSKVVSIPSASIGLDVAYCHSASTDTPNTLFTFIDDRITGVGSSGVNGETFTCKIQTKTYDFDVPHLYKVMSHWEVQVATSTAVTAASNMPNSSASPTWYAWNQTYTWYSINAAGITWDSKITLSVGSTVNPAGGQYGRKMLKIPKKQRFRQVYFTLETNAVTAGPTFDSSVKIYDLTVFLSQKEHLVKETT